MILLTLLAQMLAPAALADEYGYYARVRKGVVLRNDDGDELAYLDEGTYVYVIRRNKADKTRVDVKTSNGLEGSVIKKGIKKVSSPSSSQSSGSKLTHDGKAFTGVVKKYLNVRDENYKIVGRVEQGEKVEILGASDRWPERGVMKGGKTTVLLSGLSKVSSSGGKSSSNKITYYDNPYYAYAKHKISLRDASGNVTGTIPRGALVEVRGINSNKKELAVVYHNTPGLATRDSFKTVTDGVFVDISKQRVTLIKGGKLIGQSKCVTGTLGKADSPKGLFRITEKHKNKVFTPEKESEFWLRWCGGCGFHDAPWRHNWSSNAYKTSGSNGCINLPYAFAKTLYNNAYVGMRVCVW